MQNSSHPRNILLISDLFKKVGKADFSIGGYISHLFPLAENLAKNDFFSIKILTNSHVTKKIHIVKKMKNERLIDRIEIVEIDVSSLSPVSENCFVRAYTQKPKQETITEIETHLVKELGREWYPDAIIVWETPSTILREIYPDALVLDMMPSMFSRPPFPRMYAIDPVGLYRDCWYSTENISGFSASCPQIEKICRLRAYYLDFFQKIKMENLLPKSHLARHNVLIPLQISQHFAWKENAAYPNQKQFVESVLQALPAETNAFITRYIANFVKDDCVDAETLIALQMRYPQAIHNSVFDKISNVSQYLLVHMDTVYSISSSLGLRHHLFFCF